jgi:hypothetical protein
MAVVVALLCQVPGNPMASLAFRALLQEINDLWYCIGQDVDLAWFYTLSLALSLALSLKPCITAASESDVYFCITQIKTYS